MKPLLKHFIVNTVTLYIISQFVGGLVFAQGIKTLLITGAVLSLTTMIVKPVINLLILPINLITFGLFKWVAYAVTLYLVTLVVEGFKITTFSFPGLSTYWFSIPAVNLSGFLAVIAFSFLISIVASIIYWIIK